MEITEKWLGEIGGWQAMKAARALVAAGRVQVQEKTETLVRGHVGGEKSRLSSGLRIRSRSDVDNLCTCPTARRTGQICDHALAVALASLNPPGAVNTATQSFPSQVSAAKPAAREILEPVTAPGMLSLFLPESLLQTGTVGRTATAFLKLDHGEPEKSLLAAWLKSRGVPLQSTPLALPAGELGSLLSAATEHPRVFLGKPGAGMHRQLLVADSLIRPLVKVELEQGPASGQGNCATFKISEQPAPQLLDSLTSRSQGWLLHAGGGAIHPWQHPTDTEVLQITTDLMVEHRPGKTVSRPMAWLPRWLAKMEETFQIELGTGLFNRYKVVPIAFDLHLQIDGNLQAVIVTVSGQFAEHQWSITSNKDPFPIQDEQDSCVFYVRDKNKEKALFDELVSIGFEINVKTGQFELKENAKILNFIGSLLPRIEDNLNVTKTKAWIEATQRLLRVTPALHSNPPTSQGTGEDWLSMDFAYVASDGFRLSRTEILRLIRSGQNTVKSKTGNRYIIDTLSCQELEDSLQDVSVQLTADGLRFAASHEAYFMPFAERSSLARTKDSEVNLNLWRQQLGGLGGILRQYQVEGVAWLAQRLEAGQGALLGDDMGLGKTLQSMAVIQWLLASPDGPGKQALIVCPKTLIGNWQAEFQRFAPELRVLALHGPRRQERFGEIDSFDVIITSYQLISRDLEFYKSRHFAIGTFDEASFLRNPDTETSRSVRELKLGARLALSGTPIENGVRDLWSIFELLLPGYLGARQNFQERFEKPLQNLNDTVATAAAARLRRLIRPFFLRRTKREVLKELPEKIEQVNWCEMSATQAEFYRRILDEGREEIRAARRKSGQNGARMTMLTVLLRLRQVCCDIRLTGLPEEKLAGLEPEERSGKWPALDERLDEALSAGGKVLLFSQFVSYLRACREHLEARGIEYVYLDGSTQDRAAPVTAFQSDPSRKVFLISLKAGGYGLNLTQADTVFLMDPWWNPAVEAQAIDRAHRFGQSRVVTAYRFVMRGTVEERVLALQDKKRGLISATIEERAPRMEGLNDNDLESLLGL